MRFHAFITPYGLNATFHEQIITNDSKKKDDVKLKHLKNPSFHLHDVTLAKERGLQL